MGIGIAASLLLSPCSAIAVEREAPLAIQLQPLGKVSAKRAQHVAEILRRRYRATVTILKPIPLPKSAYYAPRARWRADSLVGYLGTKRRTDLLIGITSSDISITKGQHRDWGIFGYGSGSLRSCRVSTFRIKNEPLLEEVVTHEVGHALGLPHCSKKKCAMVDYGGKARKEPDSRFCGSCAEKIRQHLRWN